MRLVCRCLRGDHLRCGGFERAQHCAHPPTRPPPPALQGGFPSIDTRTLYQSTLLHVAARHGHAELARALLARGADVNALDYGGMRRSPLHWACKGGHVALVELLVEAGADTKVCVYVCVCLCLVGSWLPWCLPLPPLHTRTTWLAGTLLRLHCSVTTHTNP